MRDGWRELGRDYGEVSLKIIFAFTLALIAFAVSGCASVVPNSIKGSCQVFERPPYALRGKSEYDQAVPDKYVESGVAACGWQRPAVRPAQLDAAPIAAAPSQHAVKEKIWPDAPPPADILTPAEASPSVVVEPPAMVAPEPSPAPPPRSKLDRLL